MTPLPFILNIAGWMLTENGRQPWIVQGLQLVKDGVSPSVGTATIVTSIIVFFLLYAVLAIVDTVLMTHYARKQLAADVPRPDETGRRAGVHLLGTVMTTFWFIVIAVLWTGFIILEGFDFGVGALHGVVGRDDAGRREVIHTIAPVWDGNEVWLIVAGAAMFAAFPGWYATRFSGLYLALVLLLVALILRGVGIEFRHKRDSARWRRGWSIALAVCSLVVPLLIGVALADFASGLPIDASQEFTGGFADLLPLYSVVVGLTFVAVTLCTGPCSSPSSCTVSRTTARPGPPGSSPRWPASSPWPW